ncbi:restriction endonuclease subunit S [Bacillus sp. AW]|uniref:restriction endonuclease subunit S n=1 Tax=Bacillus sp. AW TaxID=2293329 RepID=UPI000E2FD20D|nr:restriction endonuclease subunit S [Bacillus sp. AW]
MNSNSWKVKKWGDLVELKYGKSLKNYKEKTIGYRVFGTNGPIGYNEEALCEQETVIVGRKGAYRGVHYSDKPCYVIDTAFYTVPIEEINMKWAFYELLTKNINNLDSGSAIPSTSREDFYSLKSKVPPIGVQNKIVNILSIFEEKIELNSKMISNLEQLSQTLFKHWFIDFEFPNEQGQPYKSSGGEMVEIELGEIPSIFKCGTIKDFCDLKYGKALTKKNRIPGAYPVYGSGGLTGTHKEYLIEGPGVIIGRKGSIGTLYLEFNNFYPIDTVFYTESKDYTPMFLYLLFKQYDFTKANNDSAVPGLNRDFVYNTKAVVPDLKIVNKFKEIITPIYETIRNLSEENSILEELRDTLLPKLLSGEIKIPDEVVVD